MTRRTHLPCNSCGSSDALADYGDHTYCFSCGRTKSAGEDDGESPAGGSLVPLGELSYIHIPARGLSVDTIKKYSYGICGGLQIATYFDTNGRPAYQKTRDRDKNFRVLKAENPSAPLKELLFGRHLFGDHGGQALVICEGEIDTLSAHQALRTMGSSVHCVGVPCGSQGALETIKANLDWIDKYQSIYLGFDNDDPGLKASEEVARFLGSTKVHRINLPPEAKDINELLVTSGPPGVITAYSEARAWKPLGLIDPKDYLSIATEDPARGIPWPWDGLNETTYGIIPGLILLAAGSGIGKTTWFKQVEAHCLRLGHRIGVIHLEESARMTINSLFSLLHGRDFHTPDSTVSMSDREAAVSSLRDSGQLVLFDKAVGFDEDTLLGVIKFMVKSLGCSVVFLDHLTAISDQYDRDVNQKTRNLIVKLGKLVTILGFPLVAISHLRKAEGKAHEEGGRVHLDDLLGSGAIKQWAEHVLALERNNQDEDPNARNRPFLRDLKNRPMGEHTGTVLPLEYHPSTFTLEELKGFRGAPPKVTKVTDTPF